MIDITEKWAVSLSIDHLDPSPMVMTFDTWDEAHDWLAREIDQRVQWYVETMPYSVTEDEREGLIENEFTLAKIERKRFVKLTTKENAA